MNENAIVTFYHLYFTDESELTTTDLAKLVFEVEGAEEVRNADRKIRHYLCESYPHLVNTSVRDGTKHFSLREDRVWFGLGKMVVVTPEAEEITTGFGEVMVYEDENGDPEVVSIEYEADITEDPESGEPDPAC